MTDLRSIREELPAKWQVYLICTKAEWEMLMRHIDQPVTTVAVTSLSQPITWVNATGFDGLSSIDHRWVLRHELAHIKCKCDLGESGRDTSVSMALNFGLGRHL
jgi:hypothetical protein